ncbi:MAG TPA: DUF6599 family protein [Blastocatellia bacterium]|nr:DUF6599 family protein [Blastocatellia bacterium]
MRESGSLFVRAALTAGLCGLLGASGLAQFRAQQAEVTALATARPLSELLPDLLAGNRATGPASFYGRDKLTELVADQGEVYLEYRVVDAASREYGPARVEIYRTDTPYSALGLFSYSSGGTRHDGHWLLNGLVFWRSEFFVRIVTRNRVQPAERASLTTMADQLRQRIAPKAIEAVPTVVTSVPKDLRTPVTVRYMLGPQALKRFLNRGTEPFQFEGGAEAVLAEYPQGTGTAPLNFLVVEYHTPQFASAAMERVNAYVESLSPDEQSHTIARRVGNYVIEATNVSDRDLGVKLTDSVTYPYGVRWLKDPNIPDEDRYYGQKTAQVLISTFGIIGLVMIVAGVVGTAFGAIIFLKRRRELRALFSDAGGMLRLDIDPLPGTSIGAGQNRGLIGSGEE